MSEIDTYRHKLLGFIKCPFEEEVGIPGRNEIPIYKILETVKFKDSFLANENDVLVGGGSGEVPALRIAMPKAGLFFSDENWEDFNEVSELYQNFWAAEEAYILCCGFRKIGWNPVDQGIESWIAAHVISFLRTNWFKEFPNSFGFDKIDQDGRICRLPNKKFE